MKRDLKGRGDSDDPLENAARLLDQGQTNAALQLLIPLNQQYPDDPEIAIALGLASLKTNRIARACKVFDHFVTHWPRHRKIEQLIQALKDLAEPRRRRLEFLHLSESDLDYAVAFEESNAFMGAGKFAEARAATETLLAERPGCSPARNNLSYLMWLDGDAEGARAQTERILSDEPDNLQALCHLIRYHCLNGDETSARALVDRVRKLPNQGSDACATKIEAMSFLPDDLAIVAIYEQAVESNSEQDGTNPMLHHLAAVAHARLGNEAAARALWHQALRVSSEFELAKSNLDDAKARPADRHGAWPFNLSNWVAARDLAELQDQMRDAGEEGIGSAMRAWIEKRRGALTLIRRLLERGDPMGRDFAVMLATHARSPETDALLADYAVGPNGPDKVRLEAFKQALERGALPRGPVRISMHGEQHYTVAQAHNLVERPMEGAIRKLVAQLNQEDADAARSLAKEVGEDTPIGRLALARAALVRAEHDAARSLLDSVLAENFLSRTELATLCELDIELHAALHENDTARAWLDVWTQVRSDAPGLARWRKRLEG